MCFLYDRHGYCYLRWSTRWLFFEFPVDPFHVDGRLLSCLITKDRRGVFRVSLLSNKAGFWRACWCYCRLAAYSFEVFHDVAAVADDVLRWTMAAWRFTSGVWGLSVSLTGFLVGFLTNVTGSGFVAVLLLLVLGAHGCVGVVYCLGGRGVIL